MKFFAACRSWYFALFGDVSLSKHTYFACLCLEKKSVNFVHNFFCSLHMFRRFYVLSSEKFTATELVKISFLQKNVCFSIVWYVLRFFARSVAAMSFRLFSLIIWLICTRFWNFKRFLPILFWERGTYFHASLTAKLREKMRNIRNGMLLKSFKNYFMFFSGQTSLHEIFV